MAGFNNLINRRVRKSRCYRRSYWITFVDWRDRWRFVLADRRNRTNRRVENDHSSYFDK